jgi:hypothetical protein
VHLTVRPGIYQLLARKSWVIAMPIKIKMLHRPHLEQMQREGNTNRP